MKKFITGKSYKLNTRHNYYITVIKRTNNYLTFYYSGNVYKKKIYKSNLFALGENIQVPAGNGKLIYFCFANFEKE